MHCSSPIIRISAFGSFLALTAHGFALMPPSLGSTENSVRQPRLNVLQSSANDPWPNELNRRSRFSSGSDIDPNRRSPFSSDSAANEEQPRAPSSSSHEESNHMKIRSSSFPSDKSSRSRFPSGYADHQPNTNGRLPLSSSGSSANFHQERSPFLSSSSAANSSQSRSSSSYGHGTLAEPPNHKSSPFPSSRSRFPSGYANQQPGNSGRLPFSSSGSSSYSAPNTGVPNNDRSPFSSGSSVNNNPWLNSNHHQHHHRSSFHASSSSYYEYYGNSPLSASSSASIPFMITHKMKRVLIEELRYTRREVNGMCAERARSIIASGVAACPPKRY
jgi:hypothetical protein